MLRKTFKARKAIQSIQFGKRLNGGCTKLECENESRRERTQDRSMWTKELERFARNTYQDDQMKEEAMKRFRTWEREARR